MFRKIYCDVFSDNIFRLDYQSKSTITEFDCEQLLQNTIMLSKPIDLCKLVQSIIIKNCTLVSTESDKFNMKSDDKLQKKRYSNGEFGNCYDFNDTIKSLFDGINQADIDRFMIGR